MTINLLPWRQTLHQQRKKRLLIESTGIFILTVLCSIIWQVDRYYSSHNQQEQYNLLLKKQTALSTQYVKALDQKKQQTTERKKEKFLKIQQRANQNLFNALDKLITEMPPEIYLTEIKNKENKIYLTGKSPSHIELSTFLQHIATKMHRQPIVTETTHTEGKIVEIDFTVGYEITNL